jgi:hypothetical protein
MERYIRDPVAAWFADRKRIRYLASYLGYLCFSSIWLFRGDGRTAEPEALRRGGSWGLLRGEPVGGGTTAVS